MRINSRKTDDMFGEECDIKYIKTYTKNEFINRYEEVMSNGYNVIWKGKDNIILRYKWNSTDILVLSCKQHIKQSWYDADFVFYNKEITNDKKGNRFLYCLKPNESIYKIPNSNFYCIYNK